MTVAGKGVEEEGRRRGDGRPSKFGFRYGEETRREGSWRKGLVSNAWTTRIETFVVGNVMVDK
jgi:hypothetical protein